MNQKLWISCFNYCRLFFSSHSGLRDENRHREAGTYQRKEQVSEINCLLCSTIPLLRVNARKCYQHDYIGNSFIYAPAISTTTLMFHRKKQSGWCPKLTWESNAVLFQLLVSVYVRLWKIIIIINKMVRVAE